MKKIRQKKSLLKIIEDSVLINRFIAISGLLISVFCVVILLIAAVRGDSIPIMQRYHQAGNSYVIANKSDGFLSYCLAVILNLFFIGMLVRYSLKAWKDSQRFQQRHRNKLNWNNPKLSTINE